MGRLKSFYHDELMLQQADMPLDQQMTEAEIEDYLDKLYEEWVAKQQAYYYEDNYRPFETKPKLT